MYKDIYQLWKTESKTYKAKDISVFYREQNGDWLLEYKDKNKDVLTVKNIDGEFLVYFREAEAKNVGEGDLIMYITQDEQMEIDPDSNMFRDIREKMSEELSDIMNSYIDDSSKRVARYGEEIQGQGRRAKSAEVER